MPRISTLIVDDEPLARERLRGLLQAEGTIEVVGECTDGNEALTVIRIARPQVVFLDVQMPGCDGLQLAARLPERDRPLLIFVTAHERYALEAFNLGAVDYLLKPFGSERLHQALDRVQAQLAVPPGEPPAPPAQRLSFRVEGRIVFRPAREIVWIETQERQVALHLRDGCLAISETPAEIEARLAPLGFVRVNRSALVSLGQVREVRLAEHGDHTVVLRDQTELPLSRGLRAPLERMLAGPR